MKITSNNITSRWFEIEPLVSEELKLNYDTILKSVDYIETSTEIQPQDLIHFRDEQALTARFLELLGADIVEYLIDFNDVYKLGADPFYESLTIQLIENK